MAARLRSGGAGRQGEGHRNARREFEDAAGDASKKIERLQPPAEEATTSERMLWAMNLYLSSFFSDDGQFVGRFRDIQKIREDVLEMAVRLLSGKVQVYNIDELRELNLGTLEGAMMLCNEIIRLSVAIDTACATEERGRASIRINGRAMTVDEGEMIGNLLVKQILTDMIIFSQIRFGREVGTAVVPVGKDEFLGDAHLMVCGIKKRTE